MRQYIISGNNEERPFSRNQRRWLYASSKIQNNYFGFGTDVEYRQDYPVVKHRTFAEIAPHAGSIVMRTPSYRARRSRRPAQPRQGIPAEFGGEHLRDGFGRALGRGERSA